MIENMEEHVLLNHYEEAAEYIEKIGILPLASLIPDYPSLDRITPKDSWHSGTERDPWGWRTRFPLEGKAAYGKFFRKKAVLISAEWFPWVYACLRLGADADQCYKNGLLSPTAWQLYQLIEIEQGIDTRVLRDRAQMKAKEDKKAFDQAVAELQGAMLVVISGVKPKVDEQGEINGWSSTSYETTAHWMGRSGIKDISRTKSEARDELLSRLQPRCSEKAISSFRKILHP